MMKLFKVSGLLPTVIDSATQYISVNEFILATDEDIACNKYHTLHPNAIPKKDNFTKCEFICMRDSIIPTIEPILEKLEEDK